MNNAGDESVAAVLETLHAMKPEKAKVQRASRLPPYRGTPARAASTTSLVPHLRKPVEKPDALTRAQELQVTVADLTQRLRDKSDQCDELHSCVSRLNKELRLSVDQASLLQHSTAEKDKEIQTLRAHVDDLYQVQQQLRAESLQSKAALTRRLSGDMVLPPSPESNEMLARRPSVALDDTMECLRLELAQLNAQCQTQSSELQRLAAENTALLASMRQWHAMLSLPPVDADEKLAEALTQALTRDFLAQDRRRDELIATCDAQRKELLAFRLEKALQRRCRATSDSIYDLEAQVEALAAANAQLLDAAQNEAARSELWATQCNVVQGALEALSDRWEASLDDERQAADEKLGAAHEHIEVLEQQLQDEAREHEAVVEAYAACREDLLQAQEALNAATNHCEFVQSQLQKLQWTRCQARCRCCDESTQTTTTTTSAASTPCPEDVPRHEAVSSKASAIVAAGDFASAVVGGASVLPDDTNTLSINSGDASNDKATGSTRGSKQGPSPVKATSQWITVIEAMQANHELELDVLRSDVADALTKLAARDAEVDQLALELEASHCAAGKLRVDYDVAAGGPWAPIAAFPQTPGGRLFAVACETFVSVDSESQTEMIAPTITELLDDLPPPQEPTLALEARALEMVLEELGLAHADVESHRVCVRDVQMQLLATESQLAKAVETNHMQAEETACHRQVHCPLRDELLPSASPVDLGDRSTETEQLYMHIEDLRATHIASTDATQMAMTLLQSEATVLSTCAAEADVRIARLTSALDEAEKTMISLRHRAATQDAALIEAYAALTKQTEELATCYTENSSAHARIAALVADHAAVVEQLEQHGMQSEELSPVRGLQDLVARQETCLATMAEEKVTLLDHLRTQAIELQQLLSPDVTTTGGKADDARPTLLLHQELVHQLSSLVRTLQYDVEMYKATIETLEADRRVLTCEDDEWPRRIELSAEIRAPMATDDGDVGPWETDMDATPCLERRLWTIPETTECDGTESDDSEPVDTTVSPGYVWGRELPALRSELELLNVDFTTSTMDTDVLQHFADRLDHHEGALRPTTEAESEIVALLRNTQCLLTRVLATQEPVATDKKTKHEAPDEAECCIRCWDAVDAPTTDIDDEPTPAPLGVVVVHIGSHEIQAGVVRSGTSQSVPDLRLLTKHIDARSPAAPLLRLGAIEDFDAFEATLRRVFSLLQVAPPQYKMVLLHKPSISPLEKERMVEMAIEHCRVASVNLVTHAQVALAAARRHTGLVVDIGVDTLYVVPIFEDMVLEHAVVKLALASPVWSASEASEARALDRLFEPDAAQCAMGVVTAILQVLGRATPVIHGTLVRHVVVTGGPASLRGLAERLHRELAECVASIDTVPHPTPIQVHVQDIYHGAAVHAQELSSYKWITRADVRQDGMAIVHTKCF